MDESVTLTVPRGPVSTELEEAGPGALDIVGIRFGQDAAGQPMRWLTYRVDLSRLPDARTLLDRFARYLDVPPGVGRTLHGWLCVFAGMAPAL